MADEPLWHARPDADAPAFDVIVIGSGYGGAIAAAELAGCRENGKEISVCVLERGREYLPGAFPSRMSELPKHVRGSFAGRVRAGEGLFDLRTGSDVSVVIANGLGGGSLINAGVMEIPRADVLDRFWPDAEGRSRHAYFERAKQLLGASGRSGVDNTIERHASRVPPKKLQVLERLRRGDDRLRRAALTVSMRDGQATSGGVRLGACKQCGDCATGCNYGAKESLDTNLLVKAFRRGARIYCGATVLRLQRSERRRDLWMLQVAHSDDTLRRREGAPRWIAARKVIVAAGTLGSTEILLRSQRESGGPDCSPLLGRRFSSNGDLLVFGYGYRNGDDPGAGEANAIADENQLPDDRCVGPTISGVLEVDTRTEAPITIEEMAVPGPLRRFAEELIVTAEALHALDERDGKPHAAGHPVDDPCAVDPRRIRHTSIFAAMGDDGADGELRLKLDDDGRGSDGQLDIVWPQAKRRPLFDRQAAAIRDRASAAGLHGRTIANPLWRYVPEKVEALIGIARGPLLSVHPLGGCAMGSSIEDGVVDAWGRVYDAGSGQGVHAGLVVLDGAIVPTALCTNPALTIAALALRAVESLRRDWNWTAPGAFRPGPATPRPVVRSVPEIETEIAAQARRDLARVAVSERLAGAVRLRDARGIARDCWVELTLGFEPLKLQEMLRPDAQGRLRNARLQTAASAPDSATPAGCLRIFLLDEWARIRDLPDGEERRQREAAAACSYALSGSLTILQRQASRPSVRSARAFVAWLRNRGLRDAWQGLCAGGAGEPLQFGRKLGDALRLASRAGEVRLFRYKLKIGRALPLSAADSPCARFVPPARFEGRAIRGRKRITYGRAANPWRQLQEIELSWLAGPLDAAAPRRLCLDQQFLAARGQPLLRIESQRDHFEALVDVLSLAAYLFRVLLSIHLWNTRKPDLPRPRAIARLPGRLPGLPDPEIHEIEVDRIDGAPVHARLTRYHRERWSAAVPPVLLIHGYSASGTTFAHPSLQPGLARYLAGHGRDVWVADLRCSAGMAGATRPWTFERIALTDIPALVDRVCASARQPQLDVVAHCMGAAMLGMAVLSSDRDARADGILSGRDDDFRDHFRAARRELPRRIRRAVLSQVGPVMMLSQRNIFRAFVMSFFEQAFGPLTYRFRPEADQSQALTLLDRLLASVPYDDDELRRENPWQPWRRTEYVGTRHRMDALYGCTFKLANLSPAVLDHIDDFFGPMNLDTLSQVIHFARLETIANRIGRNRFVDPQALARLWTFPTLSIHGDNNGLSDVATLARMEASMRDAGCDFASLRLEGRGHQDCLIGTGLGPLYGKIQAFLDPREDRGGARQPKRARTTAERPAECVLHAEAPWLGPALLPDPAARALRVGIGADPKLGMPLALCLLAVVRNRSGRWVRQAPLPRGPQSRTAAPRLLQTVRWLKSPEASDWFTQSLPGWSRHAAVRHVAAFLIYARTGAVAVKPKQALDAAVDAAVGRLNVPPRTPADARHPDPSLPLGLIDLTRTVRDSSQGLRIALGSCQYPAGILDEQPAQAAWQRLNVRSGTGQRPDLMILTGDQVYVDATAGLFDPGQIEDRCRKPYEHWLRHPQVRDAMRRTPVYTMLDDHEIDNNWEPIAPEPDTEACRRNALRQRLGVEAFLRYQRGHRGDGGRPLWLDFTERNVGVFLLDSRTERSRRSPGCAAAATMFDEPQLEALKRWLSRDRTAGRPKLIVSPAAILPRHRYALGDPDGRHADRASLRSDGWDGYPATFHALLRFIADEEIRSLVFLSGDEHLGLWVAARLQRIRGTVIERDVSFQSVHTAGLYTPYRFANAKRSEFVLDDSFEFGAQPDGTRYRCELQTRVFEGAGFTFVSLTPGAAGEAWTLACEYDDGSGAPERHGEVSLAPRGAHRPAPLRRRLPQSV